MRFLMILSLSLACACDDNRYAPSQAERDDVGLEDAEATPDAAPDVGRMPDATRTEDTAPDLPPPDVADVAEDIVEDVAVDTAPDMDGGVVLPCDELDEYSCIDTLGCILDLAPQPGTYVCRPARNECERRGHEACAQEEGCWWDFGECYCGPDEDCDCGGGPAAQCRPVTDLRPCHATSAAYCFEGEDCCPTGPGELGHCTPHGLCDGGDCGTVVSFLADGGLCEHGPCRYELRVLDGGHISIETENYNVGPRDATLRPEVYAEIVSLLAEIDVDSLEDGYGECCEADSDGSDLYVTFYHHGPNTRTVRVSDRQSPPAAMRRLVELAERGRSFVEAPRSGASPALTWPSTPIRPPISCRTPIDEGTRGVSWTLTGPQGELFGPDQFQWNGPRPEFPFVVQIAGDGGASGPRDTEILADDGVWTLTIQAMPGGLRIPRFAPGPLTIQVVLDQSFAGTLAALVVRNERGIIFASDDGFAGLHRTNLVPWELEQEQRRCGPQNDDGAKHVPLRFRTANDEFLLYGGQWARMAIPDRYDLLFHVSRAFESGRDDDGWNYSYVALAMPATDVCE